MGCWWRSWTLVRTRICWVAKNRSAIIPTKGWATPHIKFWMAIARAKVSRLQPFSVVIGVRKKPIVERGPKLMAPIRHPAATIIGFVTGNQVTISQPSSGTLTVNPAGTEMSGWINGLDQAQVTLRKQP